MFFTTIDLIRSNWRFKTFGSLILLFFLTCRKLGKFKYHVYQYTSNKLMQNSDTIHKIREPDNYAQTKDIYHTLNVKQVHYGQVNMGMSIMPHPTKMG